MEKNEIKLLKEILYKLDQVIVLLKVSNWETLNRFKREIYKDKVSATILEMADGTTTYSDLVKKVAREMKVAEITVKKKISKLKEMGFLIARREGKNVYYENSGLFD